MTCSVSYLPPTEADLQKVARNMRQSDIDEVVAAGFEDGEHALRSSCGISSWKAAIVWRDGPIAIVGVVDLGCLISSAGAPWLLGTPDLYKTGRLFWTEAKKVVYAMSQDYENLRNYVWEDNEASVRWLSKLGFKVFPAEEKPPYGERFHRFEKRA